MTKKKECKVGPKMRGRGRLWIGLFSRYLESVHLVAPVAAILHTVASMGVCANQPGIPAEGQGTGQGARAELSH